MIWRTLLGLAALGLLATLPAWLGSSYATTILCQIGIAIVFALSYNLLMGETGMLSFGHAVYFGTGAYSVVHLMRAVNEGALAVPIALLPLAGGLVALVVAGLIGLVVMRRSGIAFAMITLGLGEVAVSVAQMFKGPFGGESGIAADRVAGPTLAGLTFGPQRELYWLVLGWTLIAMLAMYALTRTPLGRIANAVRDNAERVSYLQFDPHVVRLIMYCAAGLFAGIAGGLAAIVYEIVTVEALSLATSSNVVLMSFIGGTGHFLGPAMGAALVTWLQSALSSYSDAWLFYYGVFFILTVVYTPVGLAGLLKHAFSEAAAGRGAILLARGLAAILRALPLLVGAILLTELCYRISSVSTRGRSLTVAGWRIDAGSPLAWVAAIALIVIGVWLLRQLRRTRAAREPVREVRL
ncbi:branched-chain amino acid ABC transporter permease [Bosea sp. (in: a-proteobacteria)]|uniref:branched-chain amino acid ABC transporter permease n=1 Tax=Bosea sp. (in: a-proteobacteria) TaxID=1871050 RepID=UPI0026276007|nr:branched-chain amino acid ABC transporter permease [Bosea sp. (in: a-proteobacteria)]MCO5090886.1 branched-chain amino acid ABC transporter permease [Bosea sp. (in: a-proteobacteria)]